jgi:hypothetical protein
MGPEWPLGAGGPEPRSARGAGGGGGAGSGDEGVAMIGALPITPSASSSDIVVSVTPIEAST